MRAITDHRPAFLKEAYKHADLDLVPHEGWIKEQEKFIKWDGKNWCVYLMTPSRAPRLLGRHHSCMAAMFGL